MSMIDTVEYQTHTGTRNEHQLTLYTLSTCAFCEKAMSFLKTHDFDFKYIHLDSLNLEDKRQLKAEIKAKFKDVPVFPVLVVDDDQAYAGFLEERWSQILKLV